MIGTGRQLVTILIPTYNRSAHLQKLLAHLRDETKELVDQIRIVVSDNASTDSTALIAAEAARGWSILDVRRNSTNVGPDENFCQCVDLVDSPYFWLLGDDDLPRIGLLARVVHVLQDTPPDLLYLGSEWVDSIDDDPMNMRLKSFQPHELEKADFAKRVHVWFTFMSGLVINRGTLQRALGGQSIRRYTGTNLVQLGWALPVLKEGKKFIHVEQECLLATRNNSGGYGALTVFGINFPSIVREQFGAGSAVHTAMLSSAAAQYLPGLIMHVRASARGIYADENPWPGMKQELGALPIFWYLLLPLSKAPRWMAWIGYAGWKLLERLRRLFFN